MSNLDHIKDRIRKLYETNQSIHVCVKLSHPRVNVEGTPAVIKGVYPNIFIIEENENGYPKTHSIQYSELLIGQVRILELDGEK